MNLSVESRVKAHISTPYIDADGRGVEGAYAADYADCMKSPAEFFRIQNGQGADDALAKQLEDHCASLVERSKVFRKVMEEREAERKKNLASDAASRGVAVSAQRVYQIELDRDSDNAKLDTAYHKRLESDMDMDRYMRLLVKSDEAKARDLEESVAARHARLREVAAAARQHQRAALDDEKRRREHLSGLKERMELDIAQQEEAKRARALEAQRKAELDDILLQRERESQLALEQTRIHVQQEIDRRNWELIKSNAVNASERAASEVCKQQEALAHLVVARESVKEEQLYNEMRELQYSFESGALELQSWIKEKYQVGSYLEKLMVAAKATAEKDKEMFHGLQLLQSATMFPSSLTSKAIPAYDGPTTRTIGVLTTVSEPVKSVSKKPTSR
ncbi:Hypothetical protein, putative [Bodo saltans]|uniref:Uncharacterized protein n=1 Tax=Bodo saltans TaxID=75058 RepID=A0A0S4KPH6_BODSA|nr:Hypothetical protein, putative [Bodo saltans]|eukprot:CUI14819.1 Hypothetical protein, putative [Bodo saltans]